MKRFATVFITMIMVIVFAGCGENLTTQKIEGVENLMESISTPIPTSMPLPTSTSIPTSTPSPTNTPMPTSTPVPTSTPIPTPSPEPVEDELDEAQKNSIAMLNYLAVLSQEINSSKNSRMFLEEAYASLINNTNPEKVNELTESHLSSLLDIIEKYRMISVKRDRLQYIYDQNKAKAMKEAMPDPVGLLSAVVSLDLKRFAASAIYMAVDSYSSYQAYNNDIAQEFLQDGWVLDDDEAANLHDSRKRAFMFMIEIVREDNLPGELALNESSVEKFVTWKNNTNVYQRIQFLESEEETYKAFGNYWLELADCYYEQEEYRKCLRAMDKYEELQADIFRKDYYLAQALPKAIIAAKEVYSYKEYEKVADRYLEMLLQNTESSDWSLKYFAAEMYLDLYVITNNSKYMTKAYDIAKNNVNNLVDEQRLMNSAYLAEVQEVVVPENVTKDEKKQIKEYNKALKEKRETELPPVYEPLLLNCELLFALADEIGISAAEKKTIEGILRNNGERLFLTDRLEQEFSFFYTEPESAAKFDKDKLILPVTLVSEKSRLKVTVVNGGKVTFYEVWKVKEIEREKDDVDSFTVTYTNETISKQQWSKDATVKVEIFMDESKEECKQEVNFKVSKYKTWGVLPDEVEFEQVK
ncbi:MAG: hypothetical protein PUC73_07025 [Lachnospiraceae bacterium]|nr:hypothetical protein [Lachnospiraceae bacterium]